MDRFFLVLLLAVAFCNAAEDDDSFSIGLGVLSPSYKQTIGKEKVKVTFDQKEDGRYSYTIGDPKSGNSQYSSFGPSPSQHQPNAAAYEPAQPSGYGAPAQAPAYAPAQPSGYGAPAQAPAYAPARPSGYGAPAQAPAYSAPAGGYVASPMAAGYRAPEYGSNTGYGYTQNNGAPGIYIGQAGSSSGFGLGQSYGSSGPSKPEGDMGGILPSGFSYHATEGQAFLRQGGELRQQQQPNNPSQIMPAGFSYHGTDGQAFLRQGDTPNFAIGEDKQSTGRGPAEESFYRDYNPNRQQYTGPGLVNGLVGYGPGGPARGTLPIGGYAPIEHQGVFKEHGGHAA